jgi:hypothetical protein
MMDFELAAIKSFQKYFPNATIKCCLFQFCQALHKKLKKLQLSELYQNNQEFKGIFALALIPLASVMDGWQKVLEHKLKFGCSQDVEVDSNQAVTSQPTSTTEHAATTTTRPTRGRRPKSWKSEWKCWDSVCNTSSTNWYYNNNWKRWR